MGSLIVFKHCQAWMSALAEIQIRHLMQLYDLDNLLSVETIRYQLGEAYLYVFLLRKMDNLLSVYIFNQYWTIFLSDLK